MESSSRGQLGGGFQNAGDDHGDHQVTLGAPGAGEDGFQTSAAKSAQSRGHMTMRSRAPDGEGVGSRNEGLALEHPAQGVDLGGGQSERLERVRLTTRPSMRVDSRRRTAGGELRLGTDSTYMGRQYHNGTKFTPTILVFTW